MRTVAWLACVAALVPASLRWLRVAQREHYVPGLATRFAVRWWSTGLNQILFALAAIAAATSAWVPAVGIVTAGVGVVAPLGLAIGGVSSPLRWTRRLIRLAAAEAIIGAAVIGVGVVLGLMVPAAAVLVLGLPLVIDGALAGVSPVEHRLSRRWVRQADKRLNRISPIVVAITGSYGKTTTKMFCSQLLSHRYEVVASPASFNNEMGLSRAVNEHLADGTEVFIAEMGTYGPGEIAALVSWIPPRVSVITSIGPVHLERFGTVDRIVAAKSEILTGAQIAVINVDSPELEQLADSLGDQDVVTCSALDPNADVYVGTSGLVVVFGETLATLDPPPQFAGNLACAAAVAQVLDVDLSRSVLESVSSPDHRRQEATGSGGFRIIDDTYNSNPAGASAAVALLEASPSTGRRVVVTPGMVELGPRQAPANRDLAQEAASVATDLLLVGRTNRRALLEGAAGGSAAVKLVASRKEAVEWVRQHLGPGDVVLYENDLPDHYP